jgi:hypothetical protein
MVVLVLLAGAGIGSFGMSLTGAGTMTAPEQAGGQAGAQTGAGAEQPWQAFLWNRPPPSNFFLPAQLQGAGAQTGAQAGAGAEHLHLWPKSVDSAPPLRAIINTTLYI